MRDVRESQAYGTPCPPPGPSRGPAVLVVPPGPPIAVILASPCLYGVCLHWAGLRSVYCPGGENGCEFCAAGKPRPWYGYAMSVTREGRVPRIVEVSQAAYQHCPALAANEGKLAGMGAELSRMGDSKHSGLRFRLLETSRLNLPPGLPTIKQALSRLLGVQLA